MRIPVQSKLEAVQSVLSGSKTVTAVSQEYGIARKTIYEWIQRYKETPSRSKTSAFDARYSAPKVQAKAPAVNVEKVLIGLIIKHPEWGCRKYSQALSEQGYSISYSSVYALLRVLKATTYYQRLNFNRNWSGPHRLNPLLKLNIVKQYNAGIKTVSELAKEYSVSRKQIYTWLSVYQEANSEQNPGVTLFKERYGKGDNHSRAVSHKIEEEVLAMVRENPEWSVHSLAAKLSVSTWSVWKILQKNNVPDYQSRLSYANSFRQNNNIINPIKTEEYPVKPQSEVSESVSVPEKALDVSDVPQVSVLPPADPVIVKEYTVTSSRDTAVTAPVVVQDPGTPESAALEISAKHVLGAFVSSYISAFVSYLLTATFIDIENTVQLFGVTLIILAILFSIFYFLYIVRNNLAVRVSLGEEVSAA
jgi:transposase-like protein